MTWCIRISEPQSKLWIVTWRAMWALRTSPATTWTNCSRGAVSDGAPASTLVSGWADASEACRHRSTHALVKVAEKRPTRDRRVSPADYRTESAAARLLVLQGLQGAQPGRAPGRPDRGEDPDHHRHNGEDDQLADRHGERDLVKSRGQQRGEQQTEDDPDHRTDQRGDHALLPDHPFHLASGQAD